MIAGNFDRATNLHPNPTDFAHEIRIRWMRILAGSVTSLVGTYIVDILREQVLQCLTHCRTLLHDTFTSVISSTGRVRHQSCSANDALQSLFQRWTHPRVVVRLWVHDDLLLQCTSTKHTVNACYFSLLILLSVINE